MKKNKLLITLLALALSATVVLAGCGGESYSSIHVVGEQDTSYTVKSQGGNAVQYGNYIYFINGTAGYTDDEGDANVWDKVVKGALYRAELKGSKNGKDFVIDTDNAISPVTNEYLEFVSTQGVDYDENSIDVVTVQKISPKVIGTSGYSSGGIFIYDNYVYYATPNNRKNKAGDVQYKKTDFFRTSLDGKTTQRVFTTEADSADSPYAFYKQDGKVYLVVLDGTTLKSVVMNDKKVEDTRAIAENVTGAYLPVKSEYDSEDKSVSAEDYVYFSREVDSDDIQRSGTVLELMRPSGEERTIWLSDGQTASIEAVRDDTVFYRQVRNTNTVIAYSNLYDVFMGIEGGAYKNYEKNVPDAQKRTQVDGVAMRVGDISKYTYTYAFRPAAKKDPNSNVTYVLASTGTNMTLFEGNRETTVNADSVTISAVHRSNGKIYAYFNNSDNYAARVNVFEENAEVEVVSDRDIISGGLPVDVCAGYVVYFGKIDDYASGYAVFNKLPGEGVEGSKAVFVGERNEDDVKPEDEDEEE